MPRIAPLRKIFSRPVSSGWKPVPTSNKLAMRPRISTRPAVGGMIRLQIFRRVDFPDPLRPMMPTTTPAATSKETSFSAQIVSSETAFRRASGWTVPQRDSAASGGRVRPRAP